MEKTYKGDDRVKKMQLKTLSDEFKSMKIKETKGVVKYIT